MNQQTLNNFYDCFKGILKQVQDEVKKLDKREKEILTIKNNTTQILQLLQGKQTKTTTIERKIQSLTKTKEIQHKSRVFAIIELNDLRMVTGDRGGYITLFAVDGKKEQWTKVKEEKGHISSINYLCELSRNRIVSSSEDLTLKVWNFSNDTITHIKTFEGHNDYVNQVVPITKDIIASGSLDKTIRVWNVNTYKDEIPPLKENFWVRSLLKLKNKDEMVSGGDGDSVSFWNTITFKKEHSVECCDCDSYNGLIELPNHCIAVNSGLSSTIDVIDTEKYERIKQITCEGYIGGIDCSYSSLHLLRNGTFIYSHEEYFCQISSTTYEVIFKFKMEKEFRGDIITSSSNGKYIIADKCSGGLTIFKVDYS